MKGTSFRLSIAFAVYRILFPYKNPTGPSVAEAAHLGGIIVGVSIWKSTRCIGTGNGLNSGDRAQKLFVRWLK